MNKFAQIIHNKNHFYFQVGLHVLSKGSATSLYLWPSNEIDLKIATFSANSGEINHRGIALWKLLSIHIKWTFERLMKRYSEMYNIMKYIAFYQQSLSNVLNFFKDEIDFVQGRINFRPPISRDILLTFHCNLYHHQKPRGLQQYVEARAT